MNARVFWPSTILLFGLLALSARAQAPPPQGRGGRGNVTLPDGAGKQPVEAYCSGCHQLGNIGKLDPATGEIIEYKLPEGARDPHTPLFDSSGVLWFSVQGANMAGRLDPKTGDVKVVTYPQPRSNPYGVVFTSKGVPIICEFG